MEEVQEGPVALAASRQVPEVAVLKEQVVEDVLACLARGESVLRVAHMFELDPKTVRAWRARGGYRPRQPRVRGSMLDRHRAWLAVRAPEVEFNAAVLFRELQARGYRGSAVHVGRAVRPLRLAAQQGRRGTVRFETAPGHQAQVDFGQRRLWIGDRCVPAHLFVFTLGYSRRCYSTAFPHERLDAVLQGHEQAFQHFGGVPAQIVVDNAKPTVLHHGRDAVIWHPTYADFAGYYGFRPWAHWPYRAQTKGKVESGVKYVKRNALAGKRFGSWTHLNAWLLEWVTTIADVRVHGTTHEIPAVRFAAEQLTPLGRRPPYLYERVRHRIVPTDALVAIEGSRYSVPVRYIGETVVIRERAGTYDIVHRDQVIAQHPRLGRHQVAMDPTHYAGLLRPPGLVPPAPPRWDPGYPVESEVEVRDLGRYAALAEGGV